MKEVGARVGSRALSREQVLVFSLCLLLLAALAMQIDLFGGGASVPPGGALVTGALVLLVIGFQVRILVVGRARQDLIAEFESQRVNLVRRMGELESLRAISQRLAVARTLDAVLDVVYDGVRTELGYDRVGVNLFDHDAGVFDDLIGTDAEGRKYIPENRRVTLDADSAIWQFPGIAALIRGAAYHYTDNATAECPPELRYLFDGEPKHNIMVPLRNHERVMGMISVDNLISGRPITRDEIGPLQALANQVGMAVENARLLERERHERSRLAVMATTDPLTGLPNRALLHDRLGQALRAAREDPEQRDMHRVALLLVDLDGFKEVNDTLGHEAGDMLLQEVASRLRHALQPSDTVARLGGDEFAVLLTDADEARAVGIARTILAALDAPLLQADQALSVGASVGVALYPEHGTDGSSLLRCADIAMYVAKRSQSDFAVYAQESDQHSPARLRLLTDSQEVEGTS